MSTLLQAIFETVNGLSRDHGKVANDMKKLCSEMELMRKEIQQLRDIIQGQNERSFTPTFRLPPSSSHAL